MSFYQKVTQQMTPWYWWRTRLCLISLTNYRIESNIWLFTRWIPHNITYILNGDAWKVLADVHKVIKWSLFDNLIFMAIKLNHTKPWSRHNYDSSCVCINNSCSFLLPIVNICHLNVQFCIHHSLGNSPYKGSVPGKSTWN